MEMSRVCSILRPWFPWSSRDARFAGLRAPPVVAVRPLSVPPPSPNKSRWRKNIWSSEGGGTRLWIGLDRRAGAPEVNGLTPLKAIHIAELYAALALAPRR